jgi:hypothetical protein
MIRLRTKPGGLALALIACLGLVAAGGGAGAQTAGNNPTSLFTDTFETDAGGWIAMGPHGKATMTTDSKTVKNGKGALAFDFTVGGDKTTDAATGLPFAVLLRPIADGQLAKMKALTFWARTDFAGGYAVSLQEKGEGRYITLFWLPKNEWQQVTLLPADFWLSDDKNDPKDPDNKLDLDKVENIGMVSLWSFLAFTSGDKPEAAAFITPANGQHTLWLDDVTASTEVPAYDAPEPAFPEKTKGIWLDDMRRVTLGWLPLGSVQISLDKEAPFKTRALRADYTQAPGAFIALARDLRRFNLTHQDRLSFDLASTKSAKLAISLEKKNGSRYMTLVDVPGDSLPIRRSLLFTDFVADNNGPKDPDGQLDLNQIKTLSITDISGILGGATQQNTLWIGPISAVTPNP